MRIIAGRAKGARLCAPPGQDIRPTLDRVREALFSILGPDMEGAAFLDLFAGTGANGIEALSRGARVTVFVDNDERAIGAIQQNLRTARLAQYARVTRLTLPAGIDTLPADIPKFDFLFADPPYAFRDHETLFRGIQDRALLAADGLIVYEHSSRIELPDKMGDFHNYRRSVYGDTGLSFFS